MSEELDLDAVASVVDDECSRRILVHAHDGYMSVSDLADACDVSESTVYRRLERLRDLDLVVERRRPDDRGHHYAEYRSNLERLTLEVTADGFELRVSRRDAMAKRFADLIEQL